MLDTTVTVRGVDSETWKEFQKDIVHLHGNLYGNIGQEVTHALKLWLERQRGREVATAIPPNSLAVSYDNIGGLKQEIQMVKEAVEMPLRHPELFKWLDLRSAKGVLIYGPPGTGKNILARAATAEAHAHLHILDLQKVLREPNEMMLRGVFQKARETAPSVILIPDLRELALDRQKTPASPADHVLSWLLSEMDALEEFGRVIVVGIVSSPEELEPSLRQRFRKEIEVSFPDRQGRYEIFRIITKKMPLAEDVDLERLADLTDQFQGVLLWRVCQEAAARTLRRTLDQEKIAENEVPQDKLEQIKIRMDDFLLAINSLKSKD